MYRALAVGLSLDEAVSQGRLAVPGIALREPGVHPSKRRLWVSANDWLRIMVYMPSGDAVLFPRPNTAANARAQREARRTRAMAIDALVDALASHGARYQPTVFDFDNRQSETSPRPCAPTR